MRIELTRVGLLFYLANHYTTRGAQLQQVIGRGRRTQVVKNRDKTNKTIIVIEIINEIKNVSHILSQLKESVSLIIGSSIILIFSQF